MNSITKITKKNEVKRWFCLWIPMDIFEGIKETAAKNHRTLTGEINFRLEQSLVFFSGEDEEKSSGSSLKEEEKEDYDYSTVGDDPKEYVCPECREKRGPDRHLCVNARSDGNWWCENCGASGTKKDLKI